MPIGIQAGKKIIYAIEGVEGKNGIIKSKSVKDAFSAAVGGDEKYNFNEIINEHEGIDILQVLADKNTSLNKKLEDLKVISSNFCNLLSEAIFEDTIIHIKDNITNKQEIGQFLELLSMNGVLLTGDLIKIANQLENVPTDPTDLLEKLAKSPTLKEALNSINTFNKLGENPSAKDFETALRDIVRDGRAVFQQLKNIPGIVILLANIAKLIPKEKSADVEEGKSKPDQSNSKKVIRQGSQSFGTKNHFKVIDNTNLKNELELLRGDPEDLALFNQYLIKIRKTNNSGNITANPELSKLLKKYPELQKAFRIVEIDQSNELTDFIAEAHNAARYFGDRKYLIKLNKSGNIEPSISSESKEELETQINNVFTHIFIKGKILKLKEEPVINSIAPDDKDLFEAKIKKAEEFLGEVQKMVVSNKVVDSDEGGKYEITVEKAVKNTLAILKALNAELEKHKAADQAKEEGEDKKEEGEDKKEEGEDKKEEGEDKKEEGEDKKEEGEDKKEEGEDK
ncbi:MAG: hypothetical protein ACJAS6_001325, partial [Rickettsiales bacterium]